MEATRLLPTVLLLLVLLHPAIGQDYEPYEVPNDQHTCNDAIFLAPPYSNALIVGSTTSRPLPDDVCSPSSPCMTYRITPGLGNEVSVKACGAGPLSDLMVTVYADSCWDPKCMGSQVLSAMRDCDSTSSMLSFVAEDAEYWMVVSTNNMSGGQFSVTLNEHYLNPMAPACVDALDLFGPYSPTLTLYGAVSAGAPATDMPCDGGPITTDVQWYTIFPTEYYATVSTCNPGSIATTSIQVFTGDCDEPACVPGATYEQCANGATVTFPTAMFYQLYYVVVYGREGSTGSFELTIRERYDLPLPSATPSATPAAASPSPTPSATPWRTWD